MLKNLKKAMMLDREFRLFVYGVGALNGALLIGTAATLIYTTKCINKKKNK